MAVNLLPPNPAEVFAVPGIEVGFAKAHIKKWERRDVMLMRLAPGTRVAGVFTQNAFAAAPVQICRKHLASASEIRALVVNAGNANCGTGQRGLDAALRTCTAVANALQCAPEQVLPFSTGVILEHLPVEKIEHALPEAVASLTADAWCDAAAAIMTTDTIAKAVSERVNIGGVEITVTGIAKGVGMLQPNMATMLAYMATDAKVAQPMLAQLIKEVADESFNRVTVDGDTSTNDSFVLMATGKAGNAEIRSRDDAAYGALRAALTGVAQELAIKIARDGEGATKLITIEVQNAKNAEEAHRVAKSIAHSPLVKTAFFASDPNLGRLIMAIGNAIPNLGNAVHDLQTGKVNLWLGDVRVIEFGERSPSYREEDGARVMKESEITVKVDLARGNATTTVWTCDYSYDYVKINAEYRT